FTAAFWVIAVSGMMARREAEQNLDDELLERCFSGFIPAKENGYRFIDIDCQIFVFAETIDRQLFDSHPPIPPLSGLDGFSVPHPLFLLPLPLRSKAPVTCLPLDADTGLSMLISC